MAGGGGGGRVGLNNWWNGIINSCAHYNIKNRSK